ncbi:MAG TPA: imidazole glycerol phosphate synthase subunit HisF [Bacteroidetes bacterium]|nr:imidazole glycerol phosphate synthase subunit HisF [Bacteroidota bacterium]
MFRPRVIPVLLLKGEGLVKTKKFKDERYIGDPINAVKIFNDLEADELVFLDIMASKEKRLISLDFVREVGEEAKMPFAVGGGIESIDDIRSIINAGAEKVILNSAALNDLNLVKDAADTFGSSTIVVCIDISKNLLGKPKVKSHSGVKIKFDDPIEYAQQIEKVGAGEIIIQSIDCDGIMEGYELNILKQLSSSVTIPVVALGGAGNLNHLHEAVKESMVSALAAGSMFVYHGQRRGILVNYLTQEQKNSLKYE